MESNKPKRKRLILECYLSPGDIVCMTAGVRDLHRNFPNVYMTEVRTSAGELWESNPYIVKFDKQSEEVDMRSMNDKQLLSEIPKAWNNNKIPRVKLEYPLIHKSNAGPNHFSEGYTDHLERILGIRIRDRLMKGHIVISEDEKSWMPQIQEITGSDMFYWIIVNGGKRDYTAKWWDPIRMQKVVNSLPELTFVQVGEPSHYHVPLKGNNVIDLVGKTDMRQLVRLFYHSSGVICPVTLAMHLAAAVPVRREKVYGRSTRPCVVIAGGREPSTWEAYCNHAYLHKCGALPCCDNGGCWKSRVEPLGDGDEKDKSLCVMPSLTENGHTIPLCLSMINVDDVVRAVRQHLPYGMKS